MPSVPRCWSGPLRASSGKPCADMGWWSRWRERRALERHAIPEPLWQTVLSAYPFLARRSATDLTELRRLCSLFLARKRFTGAQGLPVDDLMVHEYAEPLTGEAMAGGPVMVSWPDVAHAGDSAEQAYNVVIHEFAHVLDMRDGLADGVPLLASTAEREAWIEAFDPLFEAFMAAVDRGEDTLIDPYGAEAPEEFFAVASEAFFVAPSALQDESPALYRLLARYYRQDPAQGCSGDSGS